MRYLAHCPSGVTPDTMRVAEVMKLANPAIVATWGEAGKEDVSFPTGVWSWQPKMALLRCLVVHISSKRDAEMSFLTITGTHYFW